MLPLRKLEASNLLLNPAVHIIIYIKRPFISIKPQSSCSEPAENATLSSWILVCSTLVHRSVLWKLHPPPPLRHSLKLQEKRIVSAASVLWNSILPPLCALQQHVFSALNSSFLNKCGPCGYKMQSGGTVPVARPPSNSITCPLIILSPQN